MGGKTEYEAGGMAAAGSGMPEQWIKRAGMVRRATNQYKDILSVGTGDIGSGGKTVGQSRGFAARSEGASLCGAASSDTEAVYPIRGSRSNDTYGSGDRGDTRRGKCGSDLNDL